MKKFTAFLMAALMLIATMCPLTSYAQDEELENQQIYVELSTYNIALTVNQPYQLTAIVYPQEFYSTGWFYSEDESIAGIDSNGLITPKKTGETYVCFRTYDGATARCYVRVNETALPLVLKNSNINLIYDKKTGKGTKCKVSYVPNDTDFYNVVYESDNPRIASVDAYGHVTAHATGTANINVYADGRKASCSIKITSTDDKNKSLNEIANRYAITKESCTRYVYGTSVKGRELEAYIIKGRKSRGDKILFLDFACHGFEDSYAKDGKVLVSIGNELVKYYSLNPSKLKDYTLVIVPCANPDGTIAGKNNLRACLKEFGRCTAAHVDMNRDFVKFKGKESKALRGLFAKYNPDVYLNFHGWLNTSIGTPWLARLSSKKLSLARVQPNSYGQGFIISYVRKKYNASVCLVEYKSPRSAAKSVGKTKKFINSIINGY